LDAEAKVQQSSQKIPLEKGVQVDGGAVREAGSVHSFDAVIEALTEFSGRVEVKPLTAADRALAAQFAGKLETPRMRRVGRQS
jgi:hypothetical protein